MTAVGFLLDSILAVGWIALLILAAGVALLVAGLAIALGRWTGTRVAARYQGRRLVHYCQLYLFDDIIRAALDTNYQPRKEM